MAGIFFHSPDAPAVDPSMFDNTWWEPETHGGTLTVWEVDKWIQYGDSELFRIVPITTGPNAGWNIQGSPNHAGRPETMEVTFSTTAAPHVGNFTVTLESTGTPSNLGYQTGLAEGTHILELTQDKDIGLLKLQSLWDPFLESVRLTAMDFGF